MTEPRLMTAAEAKDKLAALDAHHAKAVSVLEDNLLQERKAELARLAECRKSRREGLAALHEAKRAKLAAYLDVVKMEGEQ